MNKQEFLAGIAFTWDGHFKRVARKLMTPGEPLQVWRYSKATEHIKNAEGDEAWWVKDVMDSRIILFHRQYGNIFIQLNQMVKHVEAKAA